MRKRERSSVCRLCLAGCGVRVTVDENEQLVGVKGDHDHPLTFGHACFKGLQAPATHNSPERILRSRKRLADGRFVDIGTEEALDEIAQKIADIRDRHGPDAIATYRGGPSFYTTPVGPMMAAFRETIGSSSNYSTATIDQPGKGLVKARLGYWHAGKIGIEEADVVILVGANPMVSFQAVGCVSSDPVKTIKCSRRNGTKLIVIDPRRTETAALADLHLQLVPGEDVTLLAGLIQRILDRGLEDRAFCARHVREGHLERLRSVIGPFTPDYVAGRTGIEPAMLDAVVSLFCAPGKRGSVFSGSGPSMGPRSSLAEHLVETINVICGRFKDVGDIVRNVTPWHPRWTRHAQAVSPARSWEASERWRFAGLPVYGERLTGNLAEAITTPGEGHVRALINDGGNIAMLVPDQRRIVSALRDLDLLVSIEPFFGATARLSHYIIAPKLQYERDDLPTAFPGSSYQSRAWAQCIAAVAKPPPGAEVVDDHHVFWGLARRLGLALTYCGQPLSGDRPPTAAELIEIATRSSAVPLDEIRKYPDGGRIFDIEEVVEPANDDAGRFEPMPPDIEAELHTVRREMSAVAVTHPGTGRAFTHRLIVRRSKEMLNNQGFHIDAVRARVRYNPAQMHPADMTALGLANGDRIDLVSGRDSVEAAVQADDSLRPGVISMSHGWGGLPDVPDENSYAQYGASTNRLLDGAGDLDSGTALAVMTGVPVYVVPHAPRIP